MLDIETIMDQVLLNVLLTRQTVRLHLLVMERCIIKLEFENFCMGIFLPLKLIVTIMLTAQILGIKTSDGLGLESVMEIFCGKLLQRTIFIRKH